MSGNLGTSLLFPCTANFDHWLLQGLQGQEAGGQRPVRDIPGAAGRGEGVLQAGDSVRAAEQLATRLA